MRGNEKEEKEGREEEEEQREGDAALRSRRWSRYFSISLSLSRPFVSILCYSNTPYLSSIPSSFFLFYATTVYMWYPNTPFLFLVPTWKKLGFYLFNRYFEFICRNISLADIFKIFADITLEIGDILAPGSDTGISGRYRIKTDWYELVPTGIGQYEPILTDFLNHGHT